MPISNRRLAPLLVSLTLALGAVACAGAGERPGASAPSETSPSPDGATTRAPLPPAPVATDRVDVREFAFSPEAVAVPRGTTVTWTNHDGYAHSVVADDRSFRSGDLAGAGGSFAHTFAVAGTFTYYCGIHNHMTGRVVVG